MDEEQRQRLIKAEATFQTAEQERRQAYDEYVAARRVRDLARQERAEIIREICRTGTTPTYEIATIVSEWPSLRVEPSPPREVVFERGGVRHPDDPGRTKRWCQVADAIATDIAAGIHGPGEMLPTAADLERRYGVSTGTITHALRALADDGLTVPQKRGRFRVSTDIPHSEVG